MPGILEWGLSRQWPQSTLAAATIRVRYCGAAIVQRGPIPWRRGLGRGAPAHATHPATYPLKDDERVDRTTVTMKVPATAGYLALLRTVVGGCAGHEGFTLDQIDDVKMAVDEAASQLLRHSDGAHLVLDATSDIDMLEVRVATQVVEGADVLDRDSFSWTILRALTDALDVRRDGATTTVLLRKDRLAAEQDGA
jgi:serine/threonine-protein kinase RsbW